MAGAALCVAQSAKAWRLSIDAEADGQGWQLKATDAIRTASLAPSKPPGMWVEGWHRSDQRFEWSLSSPVSQSCVATLMVAARPGSRIFIEGPGRTIAVDVPPGNDFWGENWNRITLPDDITLKAGANRIVVRAEQIDGAVTQSHSKGAALLALELLPARDEARRRAAITERRANGGWLPKTHYGVMFQWGEWSYPRHGAKAVWPRQIDAFDVERFADTVAATGAGYVIWSATWRSYYFPAPITAIDAIIPGRTSRRDLIGEIARALQARGMRLMLYYNGHTNDAEWARRSMMDSDPARYEADWRRIVAEVGARYGDLLAGWLIDEGAYPRDFAAIGAALRTGHPARLVSINAWIRPRLTDYQDVYFGEGFNLLQSEPMESACLATIDPATGRFASGPQAGLRSHGCFLLDTQSTLTDWAIWKPESEITDPLISEQDLEKMVAIAKRYQVALSFNIMMYEDGSMSPRTLDRFKLIKRLFDT